jgi:lipid II:glycine glycyltransferase (peptidoglycan interpeptide bridge formation enzyme)
MTEWDEYVSTHPIGTPFHLSSWLQTIYQAYNFEPLLFVKKDNNNKIVGILPCFLIKSIINGKRIVSIPFSDYGGPLCSYGLNDDEILSAIIERYKKKIKYFEIRCNLRNNNFTICHDYYRRHILELSNKPEEVKQRINKRTIQYSIRKAKESGVVIKEENTLYGVCQFFRLNEMTRTKHGVPSQPEKYFHSLFENMITKKLAYIYLAAINNRIIAASIFIRFKNTIHYKYNASDPEYLNTKKPNHLLTWYAIKNACLAGYSYIDFGRTSPDNKGLMRYKEMWGAQRICCQYHYHPKVMGITSMQENKLSFQILTKTWKLLPPFIARKISNSFYRHTA